MSIACHNRAAIVGGLTILISVLAWSRGIDGVARFGTLSASVAGHLNIADSSPQTSGSERWDSVATPESSASQSRTVPSLEICRGGASSRVLELFCKEAPGYPDIWAEGVQLLGEKGFLEFIHNWKSTRASLAGRNFEVWFDRRDRKSLAILAEQTKDLYGLKTRLSNAGNKWILDFGGNVGFTAILEATLAPDAHVLTMEPSPWTYLILRANLAQANLHSRVIALRAGMGGQSEILQGWHNFGGSQGMHLSNGTQYHWPGGEFTSPILTLKELMRTYNITNIALVKLDCEMCEFSAALAWIREGLHTHIPQMVGEFHYSLLKGWSKTGLSLADAKRLYRFMCEPRSFAMHKGCKHGRLDPLHWDYEPPRKGSQEILQETT